MKKALLLGMAAIAILALPGVVAAQEQQTPSPMYFVFTDHVTPANAAEYEAATKELIGKIRATAPGAQLEWLAASGAGAWYLYAIPMQTMADMQTIDQNWMAAIEAAGGLGVLAPSEKLVDHTSGQLAAFRPDLSYTPSNPRMAEKEGQYRRWDYWYATPGKAQDLEAVAREFVALYQANNMDSGWRVYQAITGDELPLYIVASTGMSAADYTANDERIAAVLGDKAGVLSQKALSFTRRFETLEGSIRPDLSATGGDTMAETPEE